MKTITGSEIVYGMRNIGKRQPPKTPFFAGSAGFQPAFFKKMRASRPRSQGFSGVAICKTANLLNSVVKLIFATVVELFYPVF